jgi:hypothetical protein
MEIQRLGDIGFEKFKAVYGACFGETLDHGLPPASAIVLSTKTAWLVYEGAGLNAYVHFAAIYPDCRGSLAARAIHEMLAHIEGQGFKTCTWITKQTNTAPQFGALKMGFLVSGVLLGHDGKLEILWKKTFPDKEA